MALRHPKQKTTKLINTIVHQVIFMESHYASGAILKVSVNGYLINKVKHFNSAVAKGNCIDFYRLHMYHC